jgi:HAD superfamily hydrolase (TIGR01509 family)
VLLLQAYELVLDHIGYSPSEVMFFDDSARNIMAAHELGMTTALVRSMLMI